MRGRTDLDEGQVRHERLDLLDHLGLGTRVERLELHVENRLFFRLGSRRRSLVCALCVVRARSTSCGGTDGARCG